MTTQKQVVYQGALLAAIVAFIAALVMGFGVAVPDDISGFQMSQYPGPLADFLAPINRYPELVLRFFSADTLFVISYTVVFVGLFTFTSGQARPLALLGLGAGLLTALFDASENGFYIVYATSVRNGADLIDPAYTLLIMLTYLKWMAAFVTFAAFGLAWPRDRLLNWVIAVLMLSFPLIGALGIALPGILFELRGLYFLIGFPLFAVTFWRQLHSIPAAETV
ncbi:MAG: hypothetical protein M9928_23210 [Anaerolineae bacterium]|nr:hypothetical protein [Anaerolineae bacterium]MCO5194734.1 hypothetical protein [Anaerolineae bacterium]MCO5207920.1 hypothetical protein [Anaerolineae bacterium]